MPRFDRVRADWNAGKPQRLLRFIADATDLRSSFAACHDAAADPGLAATEISARPDDAAQPLPDAPVNKQTARSDCGCCERRRSE
jgi:hypothetical protein